MAKDDDRATVVRRLTLLVEREHGGTGIDAWRAAFDAADADHDGLIDAKELAAILARAGVGNWITRGAWAHGVLEELDKSGDGRLDFAELSAVLAQRASPIPVPRPQGPVLGPTGERINAAIVRLHYRSQFVNLSPQTRAQLDALMTDWERFWRGGARALLPEFGLTWHYQTFLMRYAEAWVAMPRDVQQRTVDPRRIDVSFADAVNESMRAYVDALREEGRLLTDAAAAGGRWAVGLAALAIGGLLAFGFARRK